ncbi:hypothetical protein DPMN_043822 [Dreissena polymorpha]|uniref:Uncharacterized protein n=1 Tax=Dreissena polymorpha TaxID=45954 RepID=A0A9D4D3F2_DREPO|nr:hypothetical protein DPMN_043822 [Dreissena polymorpha]
MPILSGHQPVTHIQSPRPLGHLQQLQDSLRRYQDRLGSCRRLLNSLQCCPSRLGTCYQTFCYGTKTVREPAGDSQTVSDSLPNPRGTCKRLKDSLRRCKDRLGSRRFQNSLRRSERLSGTVKTVLKSPAGALPV